MPDKFSKETRSRIMSSIRSKNTKPEVTVRRLLWANGKRYRIHDKSIFGTPDISSKKNMVAIFIDGCFWHGCISCYQKPRTNIKFWSNKITINRKRRRVVASRLKKEGWKMLEIWEHDVKLRPDSVARRISKMF
jgi:DNA mismatch endonuclease (patch repair protein)